MHELGNRSRKFVRITNNIGDYVEHQIPDVLELIKNTSTPIWRQRITNREFLSTSVFQVFLYVSQSALGRRSRQRESRLNPALQR